VALQRYSLLLQRLMYDYVSPGTDEVITQHRNKGVTLIPVS
jgi:hypothetical protein